MTPRDKKILELLKKFRVLSRTHLESFVCPDVARPAATVNRIMKRLSRDGWVLPIPRPKDEPYLYMPNPALIHHESSKTRHYLGLADVYLYLKQPTTFDVEPQICDYYAPDVYAVYSNQPMLIEFQRTQISNKRMQEKVNHFIQSFNEQKHDARILWVVSDIAYKIDVPQGFRAIQKPLS